MLNARIMNILVLEAEEMGVNGVNPSAGELL